MSRWIYPFQGRGGSGAERQNFLWNDGNIYIMDNHRAALWCWLQHIDLEKKYGLFHIDAHYDTARASLSSAALNALSNLPNLNFTQYLAIPHPNDPSHSLIRWDNYLTIFLCKYNKIIGDFFTATHKIGDTPDSTGYIEHTEYDEVEINKLPELFVSYLSDYSHDGWILNLDLDYFFTAMPNGLDLFVSGDFIDEIFMGIKYAIENELVAALTICLSPECTGGWKNSEELCERLCNTLDLSFKLPS